VQALAKEFLSRGHDARVLAPLDPDDRRSRLLHAGRRPDRACPPDYLMPLGRTVGFGANGAVSNLAVFPFGVTEMRRELRDGGYDVVHVHEPIAPILGWDAALSTQAPVVGTFHAYSTKPMPNHIATVLGARRVFNRLSARIAVSEAAAWTGKRWFGGEYRVIPNGVDLGGPPAEPKPENERLEILFVGRCEERKGLPVLLGAFGALVEHAEAHLTVVGASSDQIERYLADPDLARHITCAGRVSEEELWNRLHAADVLCAPSLAGESFGMVLTEAFAAGTPVIASDIAGYSDVVTDGVDGILVPPGDAQRLAEALHDVQLNPERRFAMGRAARESSKRYAWPRVADEVLDTYEEVIAAPVPERAAPRIARSIGLAPSDGSARRPPQRLPSLDPAPARSGFARHARRIGLGLAGAAGIGLTALAAHKIGAQKVVDSLVESSPAWVLLSVGLMMASLFLRAASWHAIVKAALPRRRVRRRDITSGTMIGVLMSATLPARLGEPARAMVVSRRVGRMRETFPAILGTLVSQTILNVVALILLGLIIVSTTDLFDRSQKALFLVSFAPVVLLLAVLAAPLLVGRKGSSRLARLVRPVRDALVRVRSGLRVFRELRRGSWAAATQLSAWGLQLLSCYALIYATGLEAHAGIGAAAAVLFAVNVTAVVPATPSNIGVFQLAVISVLTGAYGVSAADALGYGLILQAVEIATAVALGLPALVREGLTWSDMRLRAMQAAPVRLRPATERVREPAG
jgi:phosphatidyl-myo-inositol alpha-mannosyltransferase